MNRSGLSGGDLDEKVGRAAGHLVTIGLVAGCWLTIKAIELVVRVVRRHPRHRVLLTTLTIFLLSTVLAALAGGQSDLANNAAGIGLLTLLGTAKVIELQHDSRLQTEMSKDVLVDSVLTEPWFDLAA